MAVAANPSAGRRRVAITGVAGFLGQLARQSCEELGLEVIGFDLVEPRCQGGPTITGASVARSAKVDRCTADLSEEGALEGAFDGCDTVIHLAADGRPHADFLSDVLPSNIQGTFRVLEEAQRAGVRRVIFASTNHTQHGATMQLGSHAGSMDWSRLGSLGGPASLKISDPLGRAGPDSFYGVSKICGEAMGYLYARVHRSLEFVALRIGWCLYDRPTDLAGNECEAYLRSTYLSKRDFRGFLQGALNCDLARHQGFLIAYAVSRNGLRMFDLKESVENLGYNPVDDAEEYYDDAPLGTAPKPRRSVAVAVAGLAVVLLAIWRHRR